MPVTGFTGSVLAEEALPGPLFSVDCCVCVLEEECTQCTIYRLSAVAHSCVQLRLCMSHLIHFAMLQVDTAVLKNLPCFTGVAGVTFCRRL